jgi:DNA-binding response OmpR family regulator
MKALIVDDDRVLADVLAFTLRREGYQVLQAHDGLQALQRWTDEQPDLVILDVNLPKLDGFHVCQEIRKQSDTPIVLLTVRGEEDDIVRGLELGADDYITKPFSPRQLVARTRAVLRRASRAGSPTTRQVGSLALDPGRRELCIGEGPPITLTALENRLLDYLLLNAGHVLTGEAIIDHVWGAEGGDRDMLRQLVHRLRNKLAQACEAAGWDTQDSAPAQIDTVPGLGYGLVVSTEAGHQQPE